MVLKCPPCPLRLCRSPTRDLHLCCCLIDVETVLVRGDEMQTVKYCLINHFLPVLRRVLWEGNASFCYPCVVLGIYQELPQPLMLP